MIRLFYLDYRALLRERKVLVALALFSYSMLAMPTLLSKPPAHIRSALELWFGANDPFTMFLYIWTDLAMNKLVAVTAIVVAGSIVARERDTGVLSLLWSKPISKSKFFLLRLSSAWAVLATLYVGIHVAGALVFSRTIEGFRAGVFFASMSLHLFTLLFSAALAATLAVWMKRSSVAMAVSFLVLLSLVGMSFLGFYQPAWRGALVFNPFSLGVEVLAHLDDLRPLHVVAPMVGLAFMTALMASAGALLSRRIEV